MKELQRTEKLAVIVKMLGDYEQAQCPLKHHFAPGVYIREIFMPADTIVIGKIHKTEHFNILQKGRCLILNEDGSNTVLQAPMTFVSGVGVQKVLYIQEDMVWSTVHLTNERDLDKLEAALIEPADYPKFDRTAERLAIEAAS